MLKQIIIIVVLSLLVVVSMPYAQQGLEYLVAGHDWVNQMLMQVFSGGQVGNMLRELIALLAIPLLISLIPVIIYWLIKRKWFPYFMEVLWVVWFLQTAAVIVLYKSPGMVG
jgi:hypothetical protein